MVKLSLLVMAVLTVLVAVGLRWREERTALLRPPGVAATRPTGGWVALQKRKLNRWVTAAAVAAVATMLILGGVNWLRIWHNG